ncbi:MAG: hypothetical protein RIS36_1954 [Pseudomonadota bacterium]
MIVTPLRIIPVVLLFALVAYLSLFKGTFEHIADDPGLGWHLANGSVITETHAIPRVDPFLAPALVPNSFAAVGEPRPWINEQWLGDVLLFELCSRGGWPLVYGAIAGLYLFAYFGIVADSLRRSGEGMLLVLLGIVLAFKLGQVHLIARPVLFSIVFFSLCVARCHAMMTRHEWSWSWVRHEALVLGGLIAVWANTHPAFIYGIVVLGLAMVSLVNAGAQGRERAVKVAFIVMICALATSLNPFGFGLYESLITLGGDSALRSITNEWSPVSLGSAEGKLLLVLFLTPTVCALVSSHLRRGIGLFEVLLASVFTLQALWVVRVVPFASLACLPLWAACFGGKELLPERPYAALPKRVLHRLDRRENAFVAPGIWSSVVIGLSGIVVMLLAPTRAFSHPVGSRYERRLHEMFGTAHVPQGRVVFASPDWGGAITHLMWPDSRAVIDDRTVVVRDGLYRAYRQSLRDPGVFEDLARVFGVTDALVPSGTVLEMYLHEAVGWRRVGESDNTILFSRALGG